MIMPRPVRLWICLLFCLAVFAPHFANAQVDLETLPEDFSFTSRSANGLTTVTFIGRDGDLWMLESHHPVSKDKYETDMIWTNRASQLVKRLTPGGMRSYSPHDCAPGLGECFYTIQWESGSTEQVRRTSYMVGDVEISAEYVTIDGVEYLWYQDCTTFDQWGFWIDYVRIDFEGNMRSGQRESSSHELPVRTPFEQLRKLCANPPAMVS